MEKIVSLKGPYVNVADINYGGSQNFFKERKGPLNKMKVLGGCGIVALADTFAYLEHRTEFKTKEQYMGYFNRVALTALWLPAASGMTFIHEELAFMFRLIVRRLPYVAFWGFSRKKLYSRIREMLVNDIPVILCIPRTYGGRKKDRLPFYRYDKESGKMKYIESTSGHFVVVTGLYKHEGKLCMKISSWGWSYIMYYDDYMRFLKTHICGLLGNIMVVHRVGR